LLSLYL